MFNRASSTTLRETSFAREPGRKMRRWIPEFMWGRGKDTSTGRRLPSCGGLPRVCVLGETEHACVCNGTHIRGGGKGGGDDASAP